MKTAIGAALLVFLGTNGPALAQTEWVIWTEVMTQVSASPGRITWSRTPRAAGKTFNLAECERTRKEFDRDFSEMLNAKPIPGVERVHGEMTRMTGQPNDVGMFIHSTMRLLCVPEGRQPSEWPTNR